MECPGVSRETSLRWMCPLAWQCALPKDAASTWRSTKPTASPIGSGASLKCLCHGWTIRRRGRGLGTSCSIAGLALAGECSPAPATWGRAFYSAWWLRVGRHGLKQQLPHVRAVQFRRALVIYRHDYHLRQPRARDSNGVLSFGRDVRAAKSAVVVGQHRCRPQQANERLAHASEDAR